MCTVACTRVGDTRQRMGARSEQREDRTTASSSFSTLSLAGRAGAPAARGRCRRGAGVAGDDQEAVVALVTVARKEEEGEEGWVLC